MKKPTTLPPPIPKPRPPPKPDILPKSATIVSSVKPAIPPKPRRRTPPSLPIINTSKESPSKTVFVDGRNNNNNETPKLPLKPLLDETKDIEDGKQEINQDNNEQKIKQEINQDVNKEVDDVYDDVVVDSPVVSDDAKISANKTTNPSKTQPPKKPLPPLPLHSSKPREQSTLTVRPTPTPRLSPQVSPTPSPRLSPQVSPIPSPRTSPYGSPSLSPSLPSESKKGVHTDLPTPRQRPAGMIIEEETNSVKTKRKKPALPPKPKMLQKDWYSPEKMQQKRNILERQDSTTEQSCKQQLPVQDNPLKPVLPVQDDPLKPVLPVSSNSKKINSLESDDINYNSNYKSDDSSIDGPNFKINRSEAIKKRIASRRQPFLSNTVRTIPVDVKTRRPPPPPPTQDDSGSPKRKSSLKDSTVSSSLPSGTMTGTRSSAENIPKTAEEQSVYSYAYDHTFVPVTPSACSPGNQPNENTDSSYVEPDPAAVDSFMEELKSKDAISSGQYEIPEEESVMLRNEDQPVAQKDELTDSISSNDYTYPDQVINDTSNVEELSTDSDDYHEYESPCDSPAHDSPAHDSPPPVPPHGNKYSGSYDVTVCKDDISDDEDDDDYVEPPDAQGFSEEESDEETFWGDDNESVDEPLYQVYAARTLQRDRTLSRKRTTSNEQTDTVIDDLTKGTLRNMRMLWCEIPQVIASGILDTIDPEERKRQEAMFEVITSEASYLKSMNILESHFMNSDQLTPGTPQSVIEKAQHHILFSNVKVVLEASKMFLETLRKRQTEALVISSISDIIEEFATKHFEVYVKYCSNQIYQDRVLKDLRKSPRYIEGIERLEKSSTAQCLSFQSFLVLPMQRITRLPLLVDAICHRCEAGSDEFVKTDKALKAVNKVVRNCNEGARKMERMEEMVHLQPQIEFTFKPIALVSANRWLLRRGEVVLVIEQYKTPMSKKKLKLKPVYMFLFNDLLLITKKKGENRYRVLDYAARHMTKVEQTADPTIQLDYMLSLILLENCNNKTKDFLMCAESETDKTRWLEAFNPPKAEQEGEKVYGAWDCPQVQVIHNYNPQQPDELALHEGDVINVQRKLPDGWYYGERLCDGVCGWFPANYTENIRNEHVRARNLLQRYRLLAASKHLIGTVQTMKPSKASKLTKGIIKRDTIS